MKNILIVDDEQTLLHILTAESKLDEYKEQFKVFTARNGKEALQVLESTVIDFLVTDLKMPEMDGIELLAYMSTKFPSIPAIAMSAFCTPEIEKQLKKMGTLRVLDKPVDFSTLARTIEGLARSYSGGALKGISVSSFMQLIHMEGKTCLLEVNGEGQKKGFLYFSQGDLFDASCGDLQGQPAALEMIGWDNVQLNLRNPPKHRAKKRIDKGVVYLIIEGLRLKDEAIKSEKSESPKPDKAAEVLDEALMNELESVLVESDQDTETSSPQEAREDRDRQKTNGPNQVEFILEIFKVTNSKLRLSEILQAVFRQIHDVVPFDLAFVMTKEKSRPGYMTILDLMGSGTTTISKGACYPYQGSIIVTVLKQQSPLIVHDIGSLSHPVEKELFANHGPKACLLTPLMMKGIATGILVLTAKNSDTFDDVQSPFELIANGISHAIERNRWSAELAKGKQALDVSKQIGRALISCTFDIKKVLKYSVYMIRKIMDVEAGSLFLRVKNELQVAIAFNTNVQSMKKSRLRIGQGIAGYVAAKGESIVVNDAQQSSHFFSHVDRRTDSNTRSALCVPIVSQEKVIGVIEVINKVNGVFDASDRDLLQSIADSVGIAIKSAHLYRKAVSVAKQERDVRRKL